MNNMFKKISSIVLTIILIFSIFPNIIASAATSGYYTYISFSDDGVTILDVDNSISGAVTIPSKLPWGSEQLSVVEITTLGTTYRAFQSHSGITSISIPDTVKTIGEETFKNCYGARTITLSKNLVTIGEAAFYNCAALTSIDIPDSVKSIGDYAFCSCDKLKNVKLSKKLTNISKGLFSGCEKLETIILPEVVTSISDSAFYDCSSLTSITIPDSVTSIGDYAFAYCDNLESINIPSGVTSLQEHTFFDSNNLKNITITKNLADIPNQTFGSNNIETINFIGSPSEWENMSYSNYEQFKNAVVICSCIDGHYTDEYDAYCETCGDTRQVPFSGGNGSKTNPYLIQNKYQLNNVRNYLSSHFKLIDDIEFTESDFDEGGVFYNSGTRWQPIGNSSNYFTGVFDGDGHSIVNLEVLYAGNDSFGFAGLFYGNEGTIKNVKLENAWLSGGSMLSSQTATLGFIAGANDSTGVIDNCVIDSECTISSIASGEMVVGGIAGTNYGTVTNCENNTKITSVSSLYSLVYFGGIVGINSDGIISHCKNISNISVYGSAANKTIFVGGIVGGISKGSILNCFNFENINGNASSSSYKSNSSVAGIVGTVTGKVNIKNCANYGEITAHGYYSTALAGGIVGLAGNNDVEVRECFNIGKVSATNSGSTKSSISGGICGSYNGTMYDSYNCGQVSADDYVGGIVGSMDGTCVLNSSYNVGELVLNSSNGYAGGIVGGRIAGSYFECFYLNNIYSSVGLGGVSGSAKSNTTEEMKSQATFSNFDFGSVWTMNGHPDYLYPELKNVEMLDVPYVLGDIDGVEGITDADAEYLLMYTFFPEDYPVNQECDFNGDGKVNDADAEHLLMYTFFPEDYPLN